MIWYMKATVKSNMSSVTIKMPIMADNVESARLKFIERIKREESNGHIPKVTEISNIETEN